MTKLTRAVYDVPEVKKAIEEAKARHARTVDSEDGEEHWVVYGRQRSDGGSWNTWVVRQEARGPDGVPCLFSTEEGEYVE